MAYQLATLSISPQKLTRAIQRLTTADRARFRRLWAYYQNPMQPLGAVNDDRPYRQAQEWGLPARITGFRSGREVDASQRIDDVARKEVVIENDIGWRIETMAEYLFGKPLVIASAAPDPARRELITDLLRQIVAGNGGMIFFQQLAVLSSVYGFVDVLVKLDLAKLHDTTCENSTGCGDTQSLGRPPMESTTSGATETADSTDSPETPTAPQGSAPVVPADANSPAASAAATELAPPSIDPALTAKPAPTLASLARLVRFETIEPARALPLLADDDYRVVEAYGQVFEMATCATPVAARPDPVAQQPAWIDRIYHAAKSALRPPLISFRGADALHTVQVIELLTPTAWQRYEDGKLVASGRNSLGQIPLVHIQNIAAPFEYAGVSDVEPLIPLQDELNTRLSDRAHRITMQSFKMYLGKGIEDFTSMPVAPGRMWATDNTDANVIEFGGDAANPSEESHIAEIREALDKTSGVSPIASGGVKNKLGHLTSAAALRVTMQSLLSKTEKKRITFNLAVARLCELSLAWLDAAGVFHTTKEERAVELHWASPLPQSTAEDLEEAKAKLDLGVPREVVLRELGY